MTFKFEWNEFADQPHNVAPRKERLRHHFKHAGSYFTLTSANVRRAIPILKLYRRYWKNIYRAPVSLGSPFAVSVSPTGERDDEVIENLKATGVRQTLVRIPSWEKEDLTRYEGFLKRLKQEQFDVTLALLQRREDVVSLPSWVRFLEDVFSGLAACCSAVEVGHAWNRTKWGVWDYTEYLDLARPAVDLAKKHGVKLVGPAVIDFEFHLYPPTLRVLPFDRVSSLLYVDRQGAPESRQFGWDTSRKIALLKAVVDASVWGSRDIWVTEVNWPLQGTGKFSPASGRPNVTEEEQADYLVRYFVLCLATGHIEKIFWWQLVAPGYGLIDSREMAWRRRPSFKAFQTMVRVLDQSLFKGKTEKGEGRIFSFSRGEDSLAVCWTTGAPYEFLFPGRVKRVLGRDGQEKSFSSGRIRIEGSPIYVFFS
jgi:hypothetical protein